MVSVWLDVVYPSELSGSNLDWEGKKELCFVKSYFFGCELNNYGLKLCPRDISFGIVCMKVTTRDRVKKRCPRVEGDDKVYFVVGRRPCNAGYN